MLIFLREERKKPKNCFCVSNTLDEERRKKPRNRFCLYALERRKKPTLRRIGKREEREKKSEKYVIEELRSPQKSCLTREDNWSLVGATKDTEDQLNL